MGNSKSSTEDVPESLTPGDLCYIIPEDLPAYPNMNDSALRGLINMHMFEEAVTTKNADLMWDAMEFFTDIDLKKPALYLEDVDLRKVFSKFDISITKVDEEEGWLDDKNSLVLFNGKVCLCCKKNLLLVENEQA
jgi:hypothetical protein